ncbi:dolichyl-diphosphooligosaccharide--protein glycosyltransferase [Halorubrum aquaticum]|uniref:Dolichyl-diphosphooligosaccharide--protein glycosyltransferase n=1 Tax=Halorubrum aquaticum TaxID=387340 RepID=A0A1I3A731_9EURY|nr:hypothetical protein [Halorubrum aquaticum]SFH45933.1 dolichyl-diphosphooligosaccharide--protein glycosyltransferase [Halorubrum aquaticum]
MADPHAATRELLEERPAVESALESVLAADESPPWTFDEVDVDSGTFGELVSRGIVEREGDEYRVADPEAVRAALDREAYEPAGTEAGRSGGSFGEGFGSVLPTVNPTFLAALLGSFGFLFLARMVTYRQVFREEIVTLPGNDPYFYRYHVDRLLTASPDPLSLAAIGEVLGGRTGGEPLVHTIGYWATLLVEGSPEQAGVAIAWIPVVAALLVGCLVAWTALAITEDERVAVLSVAALALTPVHALYSGVGFFDHHALDYVWVAAMGATLVWLARDLDERAAADGAGINPIRGHLMSPLTWIVAAGFGLSVVAAVFNWNGSPVLLTGVAAYVFFRSGSDLRAGHSPLSSVLPVVFGLALATGLSHWIHTTSGWQEPAVVYAPGLVLGGTLVVTVVAEVAARVDRISPRLYLGGVLIGVTAFLAAVRVRFPEIVRRFLERGDIVAAEREIAESRRLITGEYGVFFGSIDMFGWLLFIGLPALGYVSWRCLRSHEPRWLVPCGFAWPLLGFSLFEIRFTGELSPFMAIFVAVGTLVLLEKIDVAEPPTLFGERRRRKLDLDAFRPTEQTAYAVGVLLLVGSLSLVMVPAVMDTVAQEDAQVEAIEWMSADATDGERPEFVLSRWGRQRLYNYHVFGEGESYSVSSQDDLEAMLTSSDPDAEYDRFASGVGYMVLERLENQDPTPEQGYTRLFEHFGSANGDVDGAGHYRVEFVSSDESRVVFTPVSGATINGTGPTDERLDVETNVSVPGASFTYTRYAEPGADGAYSVTVAHPGTYEVGERTVTVSEADVREGRTVVVNADGS